MRKRETGKVKWFDNKRGYGFITNEVDGADVFVHHSGLKGSGFKTLTQGDEVSFIIGAGEKGPKAIDVQVVAKSAIA